MTIIWWYHLLHVNICYQYWKMIHRKKRRKVSEIFFRKIVNCNIRRKVIQKVFNCFFELNVIEETLYLSNCYNTFRIKVNNFFYKNKWDKIWYSSPHSPDIEQNSGKDNSDFRISGQFLITRNCHDSWTSDDVDNKLGPATKLNKRNKTTPKKITIAPSWKIKTTLPFFQFTANSEQSGSWIANA